MECNHSTKRAPKFIDDALKALRTLEKVTDNMMEANCDPVFLDILYCACKDILEQVCPKEVFDLYPSLHKDKDFEAFIKHVVSHVDNFNSHTES